MTLILLAGDMMFTDNVELSNEEIVKYFKDINVDMQMDLSEILDDNPLFIVEENDTIFKIIPLFNCEEIKSSNINDKILDNKCIICENDEDTIITFTSNKGIGNIGLEYIIISKWDLIVLYEKTLIGAIYDINTLNPLQNIKGKVEQISDGAVYRTTEFISNSYGLISIPLTDFVDGSSVRVIIEGEV